MPISILVRNVLNVIFKKSRTLIHIKFFMLKIYNSFNKHLPNFNISLVLLCSLIVTAITAWFSEGYFHPDEHYQIWEFSRVISENVKAEDLPWEYVAKVRPAILPFFAFVSSEFVKLVFGENPFVATFLLRLGIGIIGWFTSLLICLFGFRFMVTVAQKKWLFFGIKLSVVPPIFTL